MQVKITHHFIQDAKTIFECYIDKDFTNKRLTALGSQNINFEITSRTGDEVTLNIEHEVPADVPGPMQKFISPMSRVIQAEIWKMNADGSYESYADVDVSGLPANIVGEFLISPKAGGGSTLVATTSIECNVPLVGRMIANFVADATKKTLAEEFAFIDANA